MDEINFKSNLKGFDYEVAQIFVCGSRITGEKSKYLNKLVVKKGDKIVLDTHWEGKQTEAYLKMKAYDEVLFYIENEEIFKEGGNLKKCPHLIDANLARKDNYQPQTNALRVEIIPLMDRCALKMPEHWNKASRERAYIDIINGFILDFGACCLSECPLRNH